MLLPMTFNIGVIIGPILGMIPQHLGFSESKSAKVEFSQIPWEVTLAYSGLILYLVAGMESGG